MTAQHTTPRRQRLASGFTLVELLVVVFIIAVLAGILVPAFHRSRKLSYSTATQARIKAIDGACESFKQDHGAYPGLNRWDVGTSDNFPTIKLLGDGASLTGTQVLSMCLLDMHVPDPDEAWESGVEHRDDGTGSRTYLDVKEAQVDADGSITGKNYTLLDAFPPGKQSPILYFIARPGQVDLNKIYDWHDNVAYDFGTEDEFYNFISRDVAGDDKLDDWAAEHTPYRQDSFILLAPGMDGDWLTPDDNKNFQK